MRTAAVPPFQACGFISVAFSLSNSSSQTATKLLQLSNYIFAITQIRSVTCRIGFHKQNIPGQIICHALELLVNQFLLDAANWSSSDNKNADFLILQMQSFAITFIDDELQLC